MTEPTLPQLNNVVRRIIERLNRIERSLAADNAALKEMLDSNIDALTRAIEAMEARNDHKA